MTSLDISHDKPQMTTLEAIDYLSSTIGPNFDTATFGQNYDPVMALAAINHWIITKGPTVETDQKQSSSTYGKADHKETAIKPSPYPKPIPSRRYECQYAGCEKFYTSKQNLKKHMCVHTGELPKPKSQYKCQWAGCEKSFVSKKGLQNHTLRHTGERPFSCNYGCGKTFTDRSQRNWHETVHKGLTPYSCRHDGCTRSYRLKANRDSHECSHTGEKPWHCRYDGCKHSSRSNSNRIRHEEIHSKDECYPCRRGCKKSFNRSKNRNIHEKTQHSLLTASDKPIAIRLNENELAG